MCVFVYECLSLFVCVCVCVCVCVLCMYSAFAMHYIPTDWFYAELMDIRHQGEGVIRELCFQSVPDVSLHPLNTVLGTDTHIHLREEATDAQQECEGTWLRWELTRKLHIGNIFIIYV